jgi:hypothetical protein
MGRRMMIEALVKIELTPSFLLKVLKIKDKPLTWTTDHCEGLSMLLDSSLIEKWTRARRRMSRKRRNVSAFGAG